MLVRTLSKIKFESKSQLDPYYDWIGQLVRTLSKIKFESKSQLIFIQKIIEHLVRTLSKIKFESKSQLANRKLRIYRPCKNVVKDKI